MMSWFRKSRTGNAAFDKYLADEHRRLEREKDAFVEYLEGVQLGEGQANVDAFFAARKAESELIAAERKAYFESMSHNPFQNQRAVKVGLPL